MPLFRKSETSSEIPEIRAVEKRVAKEAHADQKNFDHAITDLSHADKTHNKSIKAADKAQHALDKAVEQEHKAVKTLNRAAHKHDAALSNEQNAEKIVQIKKQHEVRLEQDLEQKRQHLEELRQRKERNDQLREAKLADLDARAAAAANARESFVEGLRTSDAAAPAGANAAATGAGDASRGV